MFLVKLFLMLKTCWEKTTCFWAKNLQWRSSFCFWRLSVWALKLSSSTASNLTVRKRTNRRRVTSTILDRRLKLFGHIYRADPSHDHARALQGSITCLPENWRRPSGRQRQSWLWTIEEDLKTQNIGLSSLSLSSCWVNSYTPYHSMMMITRSNSIT